MTGLTTLVSTLILGGHVNEGKKEKTGEGEEAVYSDVNDVGFWRLN